MGRYIENLLYGTPVYPEATTPDGRMVAEQHRMRGEQARQHDESTGLQRQIVQGLRSAHHGELLIDRDSVNREAAVKLLGQGVDSLWRMHAGQSELVESNRHLGTVTSQGFDRVTSGLSRLEGGIRDMGEGIREGMTEIRGPKYPQSTITEIQRRKGNLYEIFAVHAKGGLSEKAEEDFKKMIDTQFGLKPEEERQLRKLFKKEPELESWLRILQNPSCLLDGTDSINRESLSRLEEIAGERGDVVLRNAIYRVHEMLSLKNTSSAAPISSDLLIDLSNSNLLAPEMAHEVKREFREARRPGTMVDMNYNLMEILDQGDYATEQRNAMIGLARNQLGMLGTIATQGGVMVGQLGNIQSGIGRLVEQNLKMQGAVIHLDRLVEDVLECLELGFSGMHDLIQGLAHQQHEDLSQIAYEMVLTRATLVAEMASVGEGIEKQGREIGVRIDRTNEFLDRLVRVAEEGGFEVRAAKRLKQAGRMMDMAQGDGEIREAIAVIDEAIQEDPSSPYARFAKALASKRLGEIELAIQEYGRTIRYSQGINEQVAGGAHLEIAKILHEEGDLIQSISHLREAIKKDKTNKEAKWLLARSLALLGLTEEATQNLLELIAARGEYALSYLNRLNLDPAFARFPKGQFYRTLLEEADIHSSEALNWLFLDLATSGYLKEAASVFEKLLNLPSEMLKEGVLDRALPPSLKKELAAVLSERVQAGIHHDATQTYALAFLALRLGMGENEVASIFDAALKQDANAYRRDREEVWKRLKSFDDANSERLVRLVCSKKSTLNWLLP